jgi:hypothetical protein
LTRFSYSNGDLSDDPSELGEESLFRLLLITYFLYGNNDPFIINTDGGFMQKFKLIQALAVNKVS